MKKAGNRGENRFLLAKQPHENRKSKGKSNFFTRLLEYATLDGLKNWPLFQCPHQHDRVKAFQDLF